MKPLVIGIAGPARAGKDTLCHYIRRELNIPNQRYAFADPIKAALKKAFLLDEQHVNGHLKETPLSEFGGKSPRQMMQWFGTDYARMMVDSNIWLTVADRFLSKTSAQVVIIPDVRFENEAQWVREHGTLIHIRRHENAQVSDHASESGVTMQAGEKQIDNTGDLDALYRYAGNLANEINQLNNVRNMGASYG